MGSCRSGRAVASETQLFINGDVTFGLHINHTMNIAAVAVEDPNFVGIHESREADLELEMAASINWLFGEAAETQLESFRRSTLPNKEGRRRREMVSDNLHCLVTAVRACGCDCHFRLGWNRYVRVKRNRDSCHGALCVVVRVDRAAAAATPTIKRWKFTEWIAQYACRKDGGFDPATI